MIRDDSYYNSLDEELTANTPVIDMDRVGSLGAVYANIVALTPEDMAIVQSLASQDHTTVSDFLSSAIREQLVLRSA
ncbi:MAG: hypothetical protein LBH87_01145 [Coriobacteriales bacterium]|jgi:hypothetical protein|nr:hypothetical protein [Coriobacteriales bacterium]